MKENINCPFWNEKKGCCKLVSAKQNEINRLIDIIWQQNDIIDGYAPPKTSLGPVPGSHGQIEGSSPIQMATVQAPPPPPFLSFLKGPPDEKKLYREQEEESKKKQEYWEKELKKMDEKEKEK